LIYRKCTHLEFVSIENINKEIKKFILVNTKIIPRRTLALTGISILKDSVIFLTQKDGIYGSKWLLII